MKHTTKTIITASMLAALTCAATMVIKIPSPLNGYINLGDCVVLLAGWLMPPVYGFLAAGVGSGLADLLSGYAAYAPATFIIKGLMALTAFGLCRLLHGGAKKFPARLVSGIAAEVMMVLGYFVFEGLLYGFGPASVNIPANGVQGAAGLLLGMLLVKAVEKYRNSLPF